MVAVPNATPLTVPVALPAVATNRLLLLHEPPETASLNAVDDPTQTVAMPVIGEGAGVTVI